MIVVKSGRAVIAVGGAYGTLSEIGHALGEGIPVVALETWELARNGTTDASMIPADGPADAVEKAIRAGRAPGRVRGSIAPDRMRQSNTKNAG